VQLLRLQGLGEIVRTARSESVFGKVCCQPPRFSTVLSPLAIMVRQYDARDLLRALSNASTPVIVLARLRLDNGPASLPVSPSASFRLDQSLGSPGTAIWRDNPGEPVIFSR
jgi:hypothetical protein